jgi:outer membrane murein-binding lipoprotein Lpp
MVAAQQIYIQVRNKLEKLSSSCRRLSAKQKQLFVGIFRENRSLLFH